MHDKTYDQMQKEFSLFYLKEVEPLLAGHNKLRKSYANLNLGLIILFIFMFVCVFCLLFNPTLGVMLFIIWFVGILYLNDKGKNIQYIGEADLKYPLMTKCMNIFFENVLWAKSSPISINGKSKPDFFLQLKSWWSKLSDIKNQHITKNFIVAFFDDIIYGRYKGVDLAIYETIADTTHPRFLPYLTVVWILLFNIFEKLLSNLLDWDICNILFLVFIICIVCWYLNNITNRKFRGIIVEFVMNKKFTGHSFFISKTYKSNDISFNKSQLRPVNLEYTKKYNVYSDNQIEARYILTPALMERIEKLQLVFDAKSICGSFKDNKLTIAINTGKDMFAMGNDFKDSNSETFENLYYEVTSVLKIVDELKLNIHV